MRRLRATGLCGVVAVCVAAWAAGPASADGTDPAYPGSVLHVTAGGPLTPSSVLTITATGTNSPAESGFSYGLDLFLVSADVLPVPCATSESAELTIATNNSQAVDFLTFEALNEGSSGPFRISTPVTLNNGTGHLLICAYSVYVIDDAAWASTEVTISRAPVEGRKPAVIKRPRVTRSGGRLRCSRGSWSGHPASYRYRWMVLHKAGTAGRGPSLTVSRRLRGRTVECSVTAHNSQGSTTATSRPFTVG